MNVFFCNLLYYACILISFYRRCVYLCFRFMLSMLGDRFWICDTRILMFTFFRICRYFSEFFLAFYVSFCVNRPSPIRDAKTNPSQRSPSRRLRPRLWTMVTTGKHSLYPVLRGKPCGAGHVNPLSLFSYKDHYLIWLSNYVVHLLPDF